jgi:hypothetical protein
MCIIAIKKPNQPKLPTDIIADCFLTNPDGAGVAICRDNYPVKISKGYMTVESLLEALDNLAIRETDTVVYHFRIATAGGVRPELCHPFPISTRKQDLFRTDLSCNRAFIHNGIIGAGVDDMSDTQHYILSTLAHYQPSKKLIERVARDTQGSRTVILERGGKLAMTGNWIDRHGYSFSNSSFENAGFYRPVISSTSLAHPHYLTDEYCLDCGNQLGVDADGLFCTGCYTEYVDCLGCGQITPLNNGSYCFDCLTGFYKPEWKEGRKP